MGGLQGLVRLPVGIRLKEHTRLHPCPPNPVLINFSCYSRNPPRIFPGSEIGDRAQLEGRRPSPQFPGLCGLLGAMFPSPGAERVIPHGLLPPLAGPHQGRYEEGAEVQPAARSRGFVPSLCLHADRQILGVCQQGY